MWVDGQVVQRSEAAPALCAAYPNLPHFIARVTEHENRRTIELLSPTNQPLPFDGKQQSVYYALVSDASFPQVGEFAA